MWLLIVGGVISISIILYFTYCEIHASVFSRLGFTDNENIKLDNVKFQKFYLKSK